MGHTALQYLDRRPEHQFWCIRSAKSPAISFHTKDLKYYKHISAIGPFSITEEIELLKKENIDLLFCKNSGGEAMSAKLEAADRLGCQIMLLERPQTGLQSGNFPQYTKISAILCAVRHWTQIEQSVNC